MLRCGSDFGEGFNFRLTKILKLDRQINVNSFKFNTPILLNCGSCVPLCPKILKSKRKLTDAVHKSIVSYAYV